MTYSSVHDGTLILSVSSLISLTAALYLLASSLSSSWPLSDISFRWVHSSSVLLRERCRPAGSENKTKKHLVWPKQEPVASIWYIIKERACSMFLRVLPPLQTVSWPPRSSPAGLSSETPSQSSHSCVCPPEEPRAPYGCLPRSGTATEEHRARLPSFIFHEFIDLNQAILWLSHVECVRYLWVSLKLTAHHLQSGEQTVFINQGLVKRQFTACLTCYVKRNKYSVNTMWFDERG